MRRKGEERVGRVGEGLGVDDATTPMCMVSPPSACELSVEDSPFLLTTPEMLQCGEFSGSNAAFFSTTKQMFTVIDNINKVSVCSTPGCHGTLKHVSTTLAGLGGGY